MQMYILARGAEDRLKRWVNDLHAQWYEWKGPGGKPHKVRLMVRPIQIYELAFPEEQYQNVLSTVQPYDDYGISRSYIYLLQKLLHLQPTQWLVTPNFKVDNQFVQKISVGTKKDLFHPDGWEML